MMLDAGVLIAAFVFASVLLYLSGQVEYRIERVIGRGLLLSVTGVALLAWRGRYVAKPKYFGLYDVVNIGAAMIGQCVFALLVLLATRRDTLNHELVVVILYTFFAATGLVALRLWQRRTALLAAKRVSSPTQKWRTLVAGAGDSGEMLLREIQRAPHSSIHIVGFVDDDPSKQAMQMHGVPVLGTTQDIPTLVKEHRVEQLVIAMPSVKGDCIRRIFDLATECQVRIRTLPAVWDIVTNPVKSLIPQIRGIEIQDLLRREAVQTNLEEVGRYLAGEHILVTGAGGSIGSELCRQIAMMSPASLTIVGKGENSIYEIEQELIQTTGLVPSSVIADVRDLVAMEQVFRKHRPTVIFHAAAHKHVPLMERNPREAILNNIQGTFNLAELSVQFEVKKFILISTDKAVKPSSIMGATKRVCEMIVSAYGQSSDVQFAAVRFGNVLGSRGSLIPLLTAQIRRGGPVTVTHKDMTRFFMTIPEAVQLVLQAGAMGSRGEVFILDMGEPVKILDLATELIRMHELVPGQDIEIKFTGIRPGEKLNEELVYEGEDLNETSHRKIRSVANMRALEVEKLREDLGIMKGLFDDPDRLVQYLQDLAWEKNSTIVKKTMPEKPPVRLD